MEQISVRELLTATGGTLIKGRPDEIIYGVSTDSRKIKAGDMFIPLIERNLMAMILFSSC